MSRKSPHALFALVIAFFLTGSLSATTYYIAANGSDSNNGTSQSSPWLHAPGMNGCSGTCSATTPQAGDKFILRGGDMWHYSSSVGSPVGLPWSWHWAGSSSSCQLNQYAGTVNNSGCIYVGVDENWFNSSACGSSWCRPKLNMDNPLSTSRPSSCKFDDSNVNAVELSGTGGVIFDNFEALGVCWNGSTMANFFDTRGTQVEFSNMYFHGWTFGTGSNTDNYGQIGGGTPFSGYALCDHNVFDGSDSSLATQANQASGMSIYNACTEIAYNFFNHVSNGVIASPLYVHDNYFQYLYEPNASTHGNIVEWNNENYTSSVKIFFYNNVAHDTNEGEGWNPEVVSAPVWMFNNVSWLYRENSNGSNGSDGSNCFLLQASNSVNFHFFNNTLDFPCGASGQSSNMSTSLQNNHFIGYSPASSSSFIAMNGVTDNGSELFQTESVANGQGYTRSNAYGPTSSSSSTVGAGANMTSSMCTTLPSAALVTACETGVGTLNYNTSTHTVSYVPGNARPSSGAWDAGAYMFASSTSSKPNPPTGLTAVVQ